MNGITLGGKYRDTLTGFSGVAVAKTEWLYGCVRVGLQSQELKDGKPVEAQWFDVGQVEPVVEQTAAIQGAQEKTGGGPDPVRRADPRRQKAQV